jgi:hypothetical protein
MNSEAMVMSGVAMLPGFAALPGLEAVPPPGQLQDLPVV